MESFGGPPVKRGADAVGGRGFRVRETDKVSVMRNAEEKVREHIRSIDAALYPDFVDEAYSIVWGYLLTVCFWPILLKKSVCPNRSNIDG
ncbi:hypothetical protein D3C76_239020 [compost metagenome]